MKRFIHSVYLWVRCSCNYVVLLLGVAAIVTAFLFPYDSVSSFLTIAAGICGLICFAFLGLMFIGNRPLFDWHLVNGKYILNVISLVLLTPFSLSLIISLSSNSVHSKNLLSDDIVYVREEAVEPIVVQQGDSLRIFASANAEKLSLNPSGPSSLNGHTENLPLFWSVYYHFVDPGNQHMASQEGRQWAALIAILGVFMLNGLLVSTIIGWVDSRRQRWLKGEIRYNLLHWRRHYVILGGNDMVDGVVRQVLERKNNFFEVMKPYVLIQTSQDVENFRRSLFSNLTQSQQKRIIIYYGNMTSSVDISKIGLGNALEVFVLGDNARTDDIESYHDTINMECLKHISNEASCCGKFKGGEPDNRLVCHVMFEYQTSFNVFKVTDINADKIRFLPFNYYEQWAQNVLINQTIGDIDKNKEYHYLPLEGLEGIKSNDSAYVHLVVVGMSRMGVALAIEAAHLAHFPNYETMNKRTIITFIDKQAEEESEFFMSRFRELFTLSHWSYADSVDDELVWQKHEPKLYEHLGGDFIDLEWEFINASVESESVQKYLIDASSDKDARLTIAVCMPENSRAVAAAVYLPDKVFKSDSTLRVLVYQRFNDELLRQISDNNSRYCRKIKTFGMAKDCYNLYLAELSEYMDKAIETAYNKYEVKHSVERMKGETVTDEEMNKNVDHNPTREKRTIKTEAVGMWSNYHSLHSMWTKFRCIMTSDKHTFNPITEELDDGMLNELGQMEHNRWVVERLLARYRPLTVEEQELAKIPTLYSSPENMKKLKSGFAHLDICANKVLDKIDFNVSEIDRELIKAQIFAYRKYLENNLNA